MNKDKDSPEQTVKAKFKQLTKKQFGQGLYCLPFHHIQNASSGSQND